MTNRDYVNEYYRTIANLNADLEKRARKEIMEFDKEIDILAIKAYDLNIDDKEDEEVLDAAYGDCEYGIVVANNTNAIKRKDDVIYIPPKTFSFL